MELDLLTDLAKESVPCAMLLLLFAKSFFLCMLLPLKLFPSDKT